MRDVSLDSTTLAAEPATSPNGKHHPGGAEPPLMPLLLTVDQAAAALNISRALLYQMIRRREVETIRIGACRRVPREALDEWLARQRAAQRAEAV